MQVPCGKWVQLLKGVFEVVCGDKKVRAAVGEPRQVRHTLSNGRAWRPAAP